MALLHRLGPLLVVGLLLAQSARAQFYSQEWERTDAVVEKLLDDFLLAQDLLLPKATDSAANKANYEELAVCSRAFNGLVREVKHYRQLVQLEPYVESGFGRDLAATFLSSQRRNVRTHLAGIPQLLTSAKRRTTNPAVATLCERAEAATKDVGAVVFGASPR